MTLSARQFSRMPRMKIKNMKEFAKQRCLMLLTLFCRGGAGPARAGTNEVGVLLQKGCFEEEANRNLDAAIQAYQAVIDRTDKDRQFVATAIFRLGECYRKQGKTNEAVCQYQRILREFADQKELAKLSREYAGGVAVAGSAEENGSPGLQNQWVALQNQLVAAKAEYNAAELKYAELQKLPRDRLRVAVQQDYSNPFLNTLLQEQMVAERKLVDLRQDHGDQHPDVQRTVQFLDKLDNKIEEQVRGITEGLARKREVAAGIVSLLEKSLAELENNSGLKTARTSGGEVHPESASNQPLEVLNLNSEADDIKKVQAMIKDSPDLINRKYQNHSTPLIYAAAEGKPALAKFLLDNKADIEALEQDNAHRTPLLMAASNGRREMVELLLSRGADVNAVSRGNSVCVGT